MSIDKLIILDRDGVINEDSDSYVKSADEFNLIEGVASVIARFNQLGFVVAVCTNQSGIGRRLFSMKQLNEMHEKMISLVENEGGKISAICFCPHTPQDECRCRKPSSFMIEDICDRFNIAKADKINVIFVGDSIRDLIAISNFGGIPVLVKTGNGEKTSKMDSLPVNTMIFDDMPSFCDYLESTYETSKLI